MNMAVQFAVSLDEIVARLVAGLHPEQIYLFGSRARGKGRNDSDYDLLVILPESDLPRHRREAHAYDLLWGIPTPVDFAGDDPVRISTIPSSKSVASCHRPS